MASWEQRWQNALRRAQEEQVRPISLGRGRYLVASSTVPGVGYIVDMLTDGRLVCTCPAGFWRRPCKHAAATYLIRQQDGPQTRERAIVTG